MAIKDLFALRKPLAKRTNLILTIGGILVVLLVWVLLSSPLMTNPSLHDPLLTAPDGMSLEDYKASLDPKIPIIPRGILPHPYSVITAFDDLVTDNALFRNLALSMGFNLGGYVKALMIGLPIGFLIGLIPLFRGAFMVIVNATRFIPLTAVTGIFIASFGIGTPFKVNFLAFGILIYLIPIIIQRIDEVKEVYLKTVYTIGATDWQTIRTVYIPSVLSRLSDDIRVLTAISWTYIIVAETSGDQGGLGSIIQFAGKRMGRPDKVFAVLLIFILIGVIQDRLFVYLDKKFFPHKYQIKDQYSNELKAPSIVDQIVDFGIALLLGLGLALYIFLLINEFIYPILGELKVFDYFFQDAQWVIHLIFWAIILFKINKSVLPWINSKRVKTKPNEAVSG